MGTRHLALLRGINVGGNNLIPMVKLREAFEALGFGEVRTYIASGNVVFSAAKAPSREAIEAMLAKRFSYSAKVVLLTAAQLGRAVAEAPRGFGKQPARFRYDVLFARAPVTAKQVLPQLSVKAGVDEVSAGTHALYFRRLIAKASQSRLPKLMGLAVYKDLTVRTWNTTTALLDLLTQRERRPPVASDRARRLR
ncbi:MAG: DUF1697 domain-containing protein [Myxococcaceae bacterium]|nr:DUF1697 domain-containing protein [Myxococcaceae bacterium]